MRGRSIKVRQIFAELRRALGTGTPAGELLRLAAALVDATDPIQTGDSNPSVSLQPAYDQMPLDKAFADGGWRIMERESSWVAETFWDDDPRFAAADANVVKVELAA
jgi:hypothetical protein